MKTVSDSLLLHLQGSNTTVCRLWKITRKTTLPASVAPQAPAIAISPVNAVSHPGNTFQFSATVTGTTSSVVWFVDNIQGGNATVGTIDSSGLYTAPSTDGTHTITGALQLDQTVSATASITIVPDPPAVYVTPISAEVALSGTQQFTATVVQLSPTTVTWYIDNIAGGNGTVGTVDSTGLYSAPSSIGQHTIKAVSTVDSSVFDTSAIGVGEPPLGSPPGVIDNYYITACCIGPGQGWGRFPSVGNYYTDRLWDAGMDSTNFSFSQFQQALNKWVPLFRKTRVDKLTGASYTINKSVVTLCTRGAWAQYNNGAGAWSTSFLDNVWTPWVRQICDYYGAGKPGDATDVIEAFEIWNEPDSGNNTGIPAGNHSQTVANWIALAQRAAPIIRAAGFKTTGPDPQSGQVDSTGFLGELGHQGGGVHLDVISRHHYRSLPEVTGQLLKSEIAFVQQFSSLAGKEWWITEVNSNSKSTIGEDAAVAYVQRLYILGWVMGRTASKQIVKRIYFWTYDSEDNASQQGGEPILMCNHAGESFYPSAPNGGENCVAKSWGTVDGTTTSGKAFKSLQRKLLGAKLNSVAVDSSQNYTVSVTYASGSTGTITWNGRDLTNANAIPHFS